MPKVRTLAERQDWRNAALYAGIVDLVGWVVVVIVVALSGTYVL